MKAAAVAAPWRAFTAGSSSLLRHLHRPCAAFKTPETRDDMRPVFLIKRRATQVGVLIVGIQVPAWSSLSTSSLGLVKVAARTSLKTDLGILGRAAQTRQFGLDSTQRL